MKKETIVRLIRNATLTLHYAGKKILVDPMLAEKGTLQSALGVYNTPRVHLTMPIKEIVEDLDLVLLTHNHIDHYDPTVKHVLPKDIPFFTQPQDKDTIMQDGFTNVEAIDKNRTLDNLTIHRTTGVHGYGQTGRACVRVCAHFGRLPYSLHYGRLQMGRAHTTGGRDLLSRLHRRELRRRHIPPALTTRRSGHSRRTRSDDHA